jgi:hypothetical protein
LATIAGVTTSGAPGITISGRGSGPKSVGIPPMPGIRLRSPVGGLAVPVALANSLNICVAIRTSISGVGPFILANLS